jgi:polyhydroxyalkanoate synthesis regulator phasin
MSYENRINIGTSDEQLLPPWEQPPTEEAQQAPPEETPPAEQQPPELPPVTGNVPTDLANLEKAGATPLQVAGYMDKYGKSHDYAADTSQNTYLKSVGAHLGENTPYYEIAGAKIAAPAWEKASGNEQFAYLQKAGQIPEGARYAPSQGGTWGYTLSSGASGIPSDLYNDYLKHKDEYAPHGKPPPLHFDEKVKGQVTVIPYDNPSKAVTYSEPDDTHFVFRNLGGYPIIEELRDKENKVVLKANAAGNISPGDISLAIKTGRLKQKDAETLFGVQTVRDIMRMPQSGQSEENTKLPDGALVATADLDALKKSNPDAYDLLKVNGLEAYNRTLASADQKLKPYRSTRVYGGHEVDEQGNPVRDTEGKIVRTPAVSYDVPAYLRDGGDEKTLRLVGFSQKDINAARAYNAQPFVAKSPLEVVYENAKATGGDPSLIFHAPGGGTTRDLAGVKRTELLPHYGEIEALKNEYYTIMDQKRPLEKPTLSEAAFTQAFLEARGITKQNPEYHDYADIAINEYQRRYGLGTMLASQGTEALSVVFSPARALQPEVKFKDISGMEWAMGGVQVALLAVPLVGESVGVIGNVAVRSIQTAVLATSGAVMSYDTARNWSRMSNLERGIAVTFDTLVLAGAAKTSGLADIKVTRTAGTKQYLKDFRAQDAAVAERYRAVDPELGARYTEVARANEAYARNIAQQTELENRIGSKIAQLSPEDRALWQRQLSKLQSKGADLKVDLTKKAETFGRQLGKLQGSNKIGADTSFEREVGESASRMAQDLPKHTEDVVRQLANKGKVDTSQLEMKVANLEKELRIYREKYPTQPDKWADISADLQAARTDLEVSKMGNVSNLTKQLSDVRQRISKLEGELELSKKPTGWEGAPKELPGEPQVVSALKEARAEEARLSSEIDQATKRMETTARTSRDPHTQWLRDQLADVRERMTHAAPDDLPELKDTEDRLLAQIDEANKRASEGEAGGARTKKTETKPFIGGGGSAPAAASTATMTPAQVAALAESASWEAAGKRGTRPSYVPLPIPRATPVGAPIRTIQPTPATPTRTRISTTVTPIVTPAAIPVITIKPSDLAKSKTGAGIETSTGAITGVRVASTPKVIQAPQTQPQTESKTETETKTIVQTKIKPKAGAYQPMPPETLSAIRAGRIPVPPGSVTWRQGVGWWTRWPPYGQQDRIFTRRKPNGAVMVRDARSAYDTIQTFSGRPPGKIPKFDMGFEDVYVDSPPPIPRRRNRESIGFIRDPQFRKHKQAFPRFRQKDLGAGIVETHTKHGRKRHLRLT